jgi:hypothetical protein
MSMNDPSKSLNPEIRQQQANQQFASVPDYAYDTQEYYEEPEKCAGTGVLPGLTDFLNPFWWRNTLIGMLVSLVIFAILVMLISRIPYVGEGVAHAIRWFMTAVTNFIGVTTCESISGYENDFSNVLDLEIGKKIIH